MTGYLRRMVNASFRGTYAGKVLFYPWGCLGRGYFVEDPAQERRIRRFLTGYYAVNLLIMVVSTATVGVLGMLLALPFQLILWPIQVHRWTKSLGYTTLGYFSVHPFEAGYGRMRRPKPVP
jgi:hypothetical protein